MPHLTVHGPQAVSPRTEDLANRVQAARFARRALSEYLGEYGFLRGPDGETSEQAEAALLAVSELVTNACRHTAGPQSMSMALCDGLLHLEVSDSSRVVPRIVPPEERGASGGFGLNLVAELVDSWAVVTNSQGKKIQAQLTISR
ncbi:ATP-binding protein [Streptomyces sp. CA-250714]|uniref:ATP-binding protein n=1 Tax=Streptomyces sp. CA-250714 TaxID=3240060 RepID=UPI003D89B120